MEGRMRHTIHYWVGDDASTKTKFTTSIKTVALDRRINDEAVQERHTMGNEGPDMLKLCGGSIRHEHGIDTRYTI